jgi:hypothetical protein
MTMSAKPVLSSMNLILLQVFPPSGPEDAAFEIRSEQRPATRRRRLPDCADDDDTRDRLRFGEADLGECLAAVGFVETVAERRRRRQPGLPADVRCSGLSDDRDVPDEALRVWKTGSNVTPLSSDWNTPPTA